MACIDQPISWLRLERFALGVPDPVISAHLAACPACRRCLDDIRGDALELPALVTPVPALARGARRRWWLVPAFAAAAAAVLFVVVPRPPPDDPVRTSVGVKGLGEVTIELVRERAGSIRHDVSRYAPGDRWKLVVTCAPVAAAWIEVTVADGVTIDRPLAPAHLPCGNRVVLPGAFTITGHGPNQVCARIAAALGAEAAAACLTVTAE